MLCLLKIPCSRHILMGILTCSGTAAKVMMLQLLLVIEVSINLMRNRVSLLLLYVHCTMYKFQFPYQRNRQKTIVQLWDLEKSDGSNRTFSPKSVVTPFPLVNNAYVFVTISVIIDILVNTELWLNWIVIACWIISHHVINSWAIIIQWGSWGIAIHRWSAFTIQSLSIHLSVSIIQLISIYLSSSIVSISMHCLASIS